MKQSLMLKHHESIHKNIYIIQRIDCMINAIILMIIIIKPEGYFSLSR